ncbi:MAG: hypothetical protein H0X16_05310 [Chloroflexi bacterium]|nr:hypothetical protein [Chloroflexota bacterium]
MKRLLWFAMAAALVAAVPISVSGAPSGATVEFKRASLRVEVNATDGDAGFQIDLDHGPWRSISLKTPDGRTILDVRNKGVLKGYGLTELFSESSEPPFTEFPLSEFKKLFPEGEYMFEGRQTDGIRMRSTFTLTHDFPAGPVITSPREDATVAATDLVVRWQPVTEPAGLEIVRYQVLVVSEDDPGHVFSTFLPGDATSIAIPQEFLGTAGAYKVEVLAIEQSGNQTLSELPVTIE